MTKKFKYPLKTYKFKAVAKNPSSSTKAFFEHVEKVRQQLLKSDPHCFDEDLNIPSL